MACWSLIATKAAEVAAGCANPLGEEAGGRKWYSYGPSACLCRAFLLALLLVEEVEDNPGEER